MSFPRYPEYKDSGVEWLGEVPSHWEVTKLSYITNRIGSGKTPSGGATAYVTSGVPFIRSQNVHDQGLLLDDIVYIDEATDREMTWSRVKPLDVLINITGASIGRSCQVPADFGRANVNQHVCVIRLDKAEEFSGWVAWAMKAPSTKEQVKVSQTGAAREGLNFEQLAGFYLCMPSLKERRTISAFLDHEAARIDALVEEQKRLIELLKEKRQAVISHAVTKGMDPDAPMKDSGVEWLGEVPAHWMVGPLRWYATIQGGVAKGKSYADSTPTIDLPYLRVANVQNGYVDLSSVNTVTVAVSEIERYRLQSGDVLMNEGGDNDKLGRGTVWEGEIADCLHQNHVFAIRPNHHLLPHWLSMFTGSNAARSYFYLYSKQSTNLASVSSSNVMSCPLPLPPREEQHQILDFLGRETARIDNLMVEGEKAISFLQERRSALISAAVTGKIDVRGWQPPLGSSAPTETTQMETV